MKRTFYEFPVQLPRANYGNAWHESFWDSQLISFDLIGDTALGFWGGEASGWRKWITWLKIKHLDGKNVLAWERVVRCKNLNKKIFARAISNQNPNTTKIVQALVKPEKNTRSHHQRFLTFMWSSAANAALPRPRSGWDDAFKNMHTNIPTSTVYTARNIEVASTKNRNWKHQSKHTNGNYFKHNPGTTKLYRMTIFAHYLTLSKTRIEKCLCWWVAPTSHNIAGHCIVSASLQFACTFSISILPNMMFLGCKFTTIGLFINTPTLSLRKRKL